MFSAEDTLLFTFADCLLTLQMANIASVQFKTGTQYINGIKLRYYLLIYNINIIYIIYCFYAVQSSSSHNQKFK